jgi:hypothetical protein
VERDERTLLDFDGRSKDLQGISGALLKILADGKKAEFWVSPENKPRIAQINQPVLCINIH